MISLYLNFFHWLNFLLSNIFFLQVWYLHSVNILLMSSGFETIVFFLNSFITQKVMLFTLPWISYRKLSVTSLYPIHLLSLILIIHYLFFQWEWKLQKCRDCVTFIFVVSVLSITQSKFPKHPKYYYERNNNIFEGTLPVIKCTLIQDIDIVRFVVQNILSGFQDNFNCVCQGANY